MLPKGVETPRLLELKAIADAAGFEEVVKWPLMAKDDYELIGRLISTFTYIDLNLYRIAEMADRVGMLKPPWAGKTAKLTIDHVEDAIISLPGWSEVNATALQKVKELRCVRNLLAHFAIRPFPKEEAFIFFTKSARDFKRAFGHEPPPAVVMISVSERQDVVKALARANDLQNWIADVAPQVEAMWVKLLKEVEIPR